MTANQNLVDISARLIWYTGIPELIRRLNSSRSQVLVFHGISSGRRPEIPRTIQPWHSADELAFILTWLTKRYLFLTPGQFFEGDTAGLLLTFDDGLANNVVHALPILESFNVPAIFFVATQHVQAPCNWLAPKRQQARRLWGNEADVPAKIGAEFFDGMSAEQLATCGRHPLLTIGSHTVSHPILTDCNMAQLKYELEESRRYLQEVSGQAVTTLAYPAGIYDRQVLATAQEAGYKQGFAVKSRRLGAPAFEIERIGLYKAYPAYLGMKLCGF